MNTLINIQKISLIFFVIFGLAHIVAGLLSMNNYQNILDIPFALTALLYGTTSLKLSLARPEKKHTMLSAILIVGAIVMLIALIYVNFFVPDLNGT